MPALRRSPRLHNSRAVQNAFLDHYNPGLPERPAGAPRLTLVQVGKVGRRRLAAQSISPPVSDRDLGDILLHAHEAEHDAMGVHGKLQLYYCYALISIIIMMKVCNCHLPY